MEIYRRHVGAASNEHKYIYKFSSFMLQLNDRS